MGGEVLVDWLNGQGFINNAMIVRSDLDASNGVIHEIDAVLFPPRDLLTTIAGRGLGTMVAAVRAAGLEPTLQGPGSFTVFAPTDAAFDALGAGAVEDLLMPQNQARLRAILDYHIVTEKLYASAAASNGVATTLADNDLRFRLFTATLAINGEATVTSLNIPCTNGILQIIDAVLTPPADPLTVATQRGLTTFAMLANNAGIAADLARVRRHTLFVPSEGAFMALAPAALAQLSDPGNVGLLRQVLLYHAVESALNLEQIIGLPSLTSLTGETLDVMPTPAAINNAFLNVSDIQTDRGLIHIIDNVLVPPGVILATE
jgi:transforming growth factor-beta-induced protein